MKPLTYTPSVTLLKKNNKLPFFHFFLFCFISGFLFLLHLSIPSCKPQVQWRNPSLKPVVTTLYSKGGSSGKEGGKRRGQKSCYPWRGNDERVTLQTQHCFAIRAAGSTLALTAAAENWDKLLVENSIPLVYRNHTSGSGKGPPIPIDPWKQSPVSRERPPFCFTPWDIANIN